MFIWHSRKKGESGKTYLPRVSLDICYIQIKNLLRQIGFAVLDVVAVSGFLWQATPSDVIDGANGMERNDIFL